MACDTHIRKMGLETTQIVSNLFSVDRMSMADCPRTQKGSERKISYPHHPSCKWAKSSVENANWLMEHGMELFRQFVLRYGKVHFSQNFLEWAIKNKRDWNCGTESYSDPTPAISEASICRLHPEFDGASVREKYRMYYVNDKPFAKWEKGIPAPKWFFDKKYVYN